MKVAERERELASQRKERHPGKLTAVRSEPAHGAGHLASLDVEAHRNNKGQLGIGKLIWRSRHRLCARQHGQRFVIERRRSRALDDAAAQQMSLVIDRERDLGGALIAARTGFGRVAFEMFDMRGELTLPADDYTWRRSRLRWRGCVLFFGWRLRLWRLRNWDRHLGFGFWW